MFFQGDKVRVVQTLLFVQGINTLLQTLFGTRLPTVIGGSWAFMVPVMSIIHDPSLVAITNPHDVSVCLYPPIKFGLMAFRPSKFLNGHYEFHQEMILECINDFSEF